MDQIPTDMVHIILGYLTNDVRAVCRFQSTCRHYERLDREFPALFQNILDHCWIKGGALFLEKYGNSADMSPRAAVQLRCSLDAKARVYIQEMAHQLRTEIGFDIISMDGLQAVLQSSGYPHRRVLLEMRSMIHDALKFMANATVDDRTTPGEMFEQKLQRFLAAQTLVCIQYMDCCHEWIEISHTQPAHERDAVMERFALLAVKSQMTPPELLKETTPIEDIVSARLDDIANQCRAVVGESQHMADKLQTLNRLLFAEMGFHGNAEDYYDYKNSLLNHVLDTKKGIPITLAILYTCVCRRLHLTVDMIGLPGHIVLGFHDDIDGKRRFLDVFHGGSILDLDGCKRIAAVYGFAWNSNFIRPLDPRQVMTRIQNNLSNCHHRASSSFPFLGILSSQLKLGHLLLSTESPENGASLVEVFADDFCLRLPFSVELLKLYGLLVAQG